MDVSIVEDDSASLVLSKTSLTVLEGGNADYTVKLATQPTGDVTVTISGDSGTDITLGGSTLSAENTMTFTTDNWSNAQTVTVSAGEDEDSTADPDVTLSHAVSSTDSLYNGATPKSVIVTIEEDDIVSVYFAKPVHNTSEGASGGAGVEVMLTAPLKTEVTIPVTVLSDSTAGTGDYSLSAADPDLTFSPGETLGYIWVEPVLDNQDEDTETVVLGFGTLPEGVTKGDPSRTTVNIADTVRMSFKESTYSATEGGDGAVVTVLLDQPKDHLVTIPITAVGMSGATEDDWSGVPDEVTFARGETSASFTVTAVDDTVEDDGEIVKLALGARAGFLAVEPATATVTLMNSENREHTTLDNCDAVWCASVTLALMPGQPYGGALEWHKNTPGSSLSDAEFTYQDVEYKVGRIGVVPDHIYPHLTAFTIGLHGAQLKEAHYRDWTVHIDGLELRVTPERLVGDSLIIWKHPDFYYFRPGDTVDLRITASESTQQEEGESQRKAPSEPRYLMVRALSETGLRVYWEEPSFDGEPDVILNLSDVDTYTIQWKKAVDSWDDSEDVSELTVPAWQQPTVSNFYQPILGLTEGVEYTVRVIATNEVGSSPPSEEMTGTPTETTPPELTAATVDGATLTLTYDETLDERSVPAPSAFVVTVGGATRTVNDVSVAGSGVTLTLSSSVTADDVVTVSYSAPWYVDLARIRDLLGNQAANLDRRSVTNSTLTDGHSTEEGRANSPATGLPFIVGTPLAGRTLAANTSLIEDDDGRDNAVFTYQWLIEESGADTEIQDATKSTYTLSEDDEGKPIRVRVSFHDDEGHKETLTSNPVLALAPVVPNSPATGLPTISGTAQVGETLAADTEDIDDEDGLDNVTYSHQWIRVDDGSESDISGATGSSYTLASADEGKTIKLRVTFTDDAKNEETLTSEPTAAVAPRPPLTATFPTSPFQSSRHKGDHDRPQVIVVFNQPVEPFDATTPSVSVTGATVLSVAEHNEDGLENAWVFWLDPGGRDDIVFSLVAGQSCDAGGICTEDDRTLSQGATRNLPGPDQDAQRDNSESDEQNSPATGLPTITGTAQVGETLTADVNAISDADGLTNPTYSYQWVRSDGNADADIDGATVSTYTLVDADQGKTIKLRVTFTDDENNPETLTSEATATVAPRPLTASFENKPAGHDGSSAFTFELHFSEEPHSGFSYLTLREHAFTVTGGEVLKAQRMHKPSNVRWLITVEPDSNADVTVVLPVTTDCDVDSAVCTGDGRMLSSRLELTVSGPGD